MKHKLETLQIPVYQEVEQCGKIGICRRWKIFMSRISADECKHMDMEWYGVDRQGNIAVFCSGGEGNLPEFVCENEERADELKFSFIETLNREK